MLVWACVVASWFVFQLPVVDVHVLVVAAKGPYYYMVTNKFENLHVLQRKINTRALLPDARPSRPILAVNKKNHLYSSPEAEYSSTYRPTGLLYPGELILPRTLCQLTVY